MKKILISFATILGLNSLYLNKTINKAENNIKTECNFSSNSFVYNTEYKHTWLKKYQNSYEPKSSTRVFDASNTYFAGKWSNYAKSWKEFVNKYQFFSFTNNSVFSLFYYNHVFEYSTRKNNLWNQTKKIKSYISGKNTNIIFQISTGILTATEAKLILEFWYTNNGDMYFKWNFALLGYQAMITIHLPQITFY